MAQKNKNRQQTSAAKPAAPQKKNTAPQKAELLERMEQFFTRNSKFTLAVCLIVAALFSLLLFSVRITEGYDDALYIEAAANYAKSFFNYYYTATAPLYPMFLAMPIAVFGLNLVLLKMFSIVFFVLGIYLYYRAFRGKIANIVLFPALFLTALNSLFLFYAGQTYTETFTLFMSGLFFCALFRLDEATANGADIKANWGKFLLIGLLSYLMLLARNVAIVIPAVVLLYFLFQRKWLTGLLSLCSFGLFYSLYNYVIMPLCWGHLNLKDQYASQSNMMLLKNPYNPGLGNEDFSGFVTRFLENTKIYISQLFDITGLKAAETPNGWTFVVILAVFALAALVFSVIRKDRRIWAALLYVSAFLAASFLSLATSWAQHRLVMIYLPLIAMGVFYAFYAFLQIKKMHRLQWIYPVFIVILLFINIKKDFVEMEKSLPVLEQNLAGDKYSGLTPDWVHYFKACEWAADTLPRDAVIACRKAPMSFIYTGGRDFYGINAVSSATPDSALQDSEFRHHFAALNPRGMFMRTYNSISPCMTALALADKKVWYVYDIPDSLYNTFVADMKLAGNKTFFDTPQVLLDSMKIYEKSLVVYPDRLLNHLRKANVGYIVDASLRADPRGKTENLITTITRYMTYISAKYPNTFKRIHQEGRNNDEPAWVYKVNYPKNETADK